MGSNAADVVERSHVPVLVIPNTSQIGPAQRVVIADDGGEVDKELLKPLRWLIDPERTRITVVHVSRSGERMSGHSPYADALEGLRCSFLTVPGTEVSEVLSSTLRELDADLLVLVHRRKGVFKDLFRKSISAEISMLAEVPMLVLEHLKGT